MNNISLSLVLPCYNEEENIHTTVQYVWQWMQKRSIDGEIIVVNDGSTDGSAKILRALETEIPTLKIVAHQQNMGYGIAVRSGLDIAEKDIIGFMDSDQQFHIEDIEKLLPYLQEYAFVTGRRTKRADTMLRNIFGKMLGVCTWLLFGLWLRDVNCGMKIFRKNIWQTIRPTDSVEKLFNTELFLHLQRNNIPWKQMPVGHYPRMAGTPTGASVRVIVRMFGEYWTLKKGELLQKNKQENK